MCRHPTRWARNALLRPKPLNTRAVAIPHGGLRTSCHKALADAFPQVAIPHGGLGTFLPIRTSPGYGICHHPKRWARNAPERYLRSNLIGVTIPHGGLGTRDLDGIAKGSPEGGHHPTRWARNMKEFKAWKRVKESLHPTRWARNMKEFKAWKRVKESLHPTRWARNSVEEAIALACYYVAIPHGGLGTKHAPFSLPKPLNSHHPTRWARNPSHPVYWVHPRQSPSHTVGSEQRGGS
jgi:hypothetical protein